MSWPSSAKTTSLPPPAVEPVAAGTAAQSVVAAAGLDPLDAGQGVGAHGPGRGTEPGGRFTMTAPDPV